MEPFDTEHLLVLGCTVVAAFALGWAVRSSPSARVWRAVEIAMALVLFATIAYDPIRGLLDGSFSSRIDLPLHASEVTALLAGVALLTRRQLTFELAWFWGLSGGLAALLTPDLGTPFPEDGWWVFVLAHSLAIVAAVELALGRRMVPRPLSSLWAAGAAIALFTVAGTASVLTGGNYMYTREPPGAGTPLDAMGSWPWYLIGGALIALAAFALLEAPFRAREARRRTGTLASRH